VDYIRSAAERRRRYAYRNWYDPREGLFLMSEFENSATLKLYLIIYLCNIKYGDDDGTSIQSILPLSHAHTLTHTIQCES